MDPRSADARTDAPAPPAHGSSDPLLARVWEALTHVLDPELPALNIVEMGLVREVARDTSVAGEENAPEQGGAGAGAASDPDAVSVTITPTFSGCPALAVIEEQVAEAVKGVGVKRVTVRTRLSPPWSTDEMTDAAREKLERFGIAPPRPHGGLLEIALDAPVHCPRCGHPDTRLRNPFGSTLCREIRTCAACQETFERFKPL